MKVRWTLNVANKKCRIKMELILVRNRTKSNVVVLTIFALLPLLCQVSYARAAGSETSDPDKILSWIIECSSNTWSHQRRRRRQQKRMMRSEPNADVGALCTDSVGAKRCREVEQNISSDSEATPKKIRLDIPPLRYSESTTLTINEQPLGRLSESGSCSAEDGAQNGKFSDIEGVGRTGTSSEDVSYVLKSEVTVRTSDSGNLQIELAWIDGQNRELLHQLLQYFKNKLV